MNAASSALLMWTLVGFSCDEPTEQPIVLDDDDDSGDDDDDSAGPATDLSVRVEANPDNPFSAVVLVTASRDCTAFAEYGEEGALTDQTPSQALLSGEEDEILVLGLRPERRYQIRVTATVGDSTTSSGDFGFETAALPHNFPQYEVTTSEDPASFSDQEVICTNGIMGSVEFPLYSCIDRQGEPVWSLTHPEWVAQWQVEALSDGTWVAVGASASALSFFDRKGKQTAEYSDLWFDGRTRFEHTWLDVHEVQEITEGLWAGAVVFQTITPDLVPVGAAVEERLGGGIIVFDHHTEEVLWDWSSHGDLGDGEPIDPLLDYEREVLLDLWNTWQHPNALLHGIDDSGEQYFWMSLRQQDWIVKIDVATDNVEWRLGWEGDFTLVDDLDSASPQLLDPNLWMYHQHAPQWQSRSSDRTRFLVFDNGNTRAAAANDPSWDEYYSRVVELEIDESTMLATIVFDYGDPDPGSAAHFYSEGVGDADMQADGQSFFYVAGWGELCHIAEVSYPDAVELWRYTPSRDGAYRVSVFPSIYESGP